MSVFAILIGNDKGGRGVCRERLYDCAGELRDTYCRNSADANEPLCANVKSTICGGGKEGNDPFASLCGGDAENNNHRIAFCDLGASQLNNQNCLTDRESLCTGNPFGRDLGDFSRYKLYILVGIMGSPVRSVVRLAGKTAIIAIRMKSPPPFVPRHRTQITIPSPRFVRVPPMMDRKMRHFW